MALTTVRPQGMGFNTGRRNLVINGAMRVYQRGTTSTYQNSGGYDVDRFSYRRDGTISTTTFDVSQENTTGLPDFPKCLQVQVKDAAISDPNSDDDFYNTIKCALEGQDLQALQYGTATAQPVTISFYVKASVAGTYCLSIDIPQATASDSKDYVVEYTINSANTWERKTITIPAPSVSDLSINIKNDTSAGFQINWVMAGNRTGTSRRRTSTTDQWIDRSQGGSYEFTHTANQTNNWATLDNIFQLTGVQFELGENASDFEHRSFGEELNLCQRYYQKIGPAADGSAANRTIYGLGFVINSSNFRPLINFPVKFRTAPGAIETSGTASHFSCSFGADSSQALNSVPTYDVANSTTFFGGCNLSGTPLNTSEVVTLRSNHADSYLAWDAEL